MGRINKVLVVVGAPRRAEKKYLLGADLRREVDWPIMIAT